MPGRALDIACGHGRHAIWLAEHGWRVDAVDGSGVALGLLRERCPAVKAWIADLESPEFAIEPGAYDLVVDTFFMHRPLFSKMRAGLRPGGVLIAAIHIEGRFALKSGELEAIHHDLEILEYAEYGDKLTAHLAARLPLTD